MYCTLGIVRAAARGTVNCTVSYCTLGIVRAAAKGTVDCTVSSCTLGSVRAAAGEQWTVLCDPAL